jgi:hypothetical protein
MTAQYPDGIIGQMHLQPAMLKSCINAVELTVEIGGGCLCQQARNQPPCGQTTLCPH